MSLHPFITLHHPSSTTNVVEQPSIKWQTHVSLISFKSYLLCIVISVNFLILFFLLSHLSAPPWEVSNGFQNCGQIEHTNGCMRGALGCPIVTDFCAGWHQKRLLRWTRQKPKRWYPSADALCLRPCDPTLIRDTYKVCHNKYIWIM